MSDETDEMTPEENAPSADTMTKTLGDTMSESFESDNKTTNLSLEAVYDVPVNVSVILGKTTMQVNQLLKLGRGAVVELDRKVGEPIDILVNNRLVARGEIVVVEDRIGVTMTEIMKAD